MTRHDRPVVDPPAFDKLLASLGVDRDAAAREYVIIHHKLTQYFEWNRGFPPEELADQTLDVIARKIGEDGLLRDSKGETVDRPRWFAFLLGVARNILRESWRVPKPPFPDSPPEPEVKRSSAQDCYAQCYDELLQSQRAEEWRFLFEYYKEGAGIAKSRRKRLARRLGISQNALAIRMFRLKRDLKPEFDACMAECLKRQAFS